MRSAIEIAAEIRKCDIWDYELCAELCKAAGMEEEYETVCTNDCNWSNEGPTFEDVVEKAAEKLGVEIY